MPTSVNFQYLSGRKAVAITAGGFHTCALLDDGNISCWGKALEGQLGTGGTIQQNSPVLTASLGIGRTAVSVSAGGSHTCAVLDNGSISCWGRNTEGQIGNGVNTQQNYPVLTASLGNGRTATSISAGGGHTCAALDNGSVSCWGDGVYGQLGNGASGSPYSENTPTLTSSLGQDLSLIHI